MATLTKFGFRRARGIVWVCDISNSSTYLNDNTTVADLEEFLPRLYIVANYITSAAGGTFVKWTGDGFLSWFETPLHRDLEELAEAAFWAARDLTFLVNITKLGVKAEKKFGIRHGLTYEHDALVLNIGHSDGHVSIDLIGRNVLLANRLASVQGKYPNILTHRELIAIGRQFAAFKPWRVSVNDRLKYFKGERRGTADLYISTERNIRPKSLTSVIRTGESAIKKTEEPGNPNEPSLRRISAFTHAMLNGPRWCKDVMMEEYRFIDQDLKGTLKKLVEHLRLVQQAENKSGK